MRTYCHRPISIASVYQTDELQSIDGCVTKATSRGSDIQGRETRVQCR